jgi:hypothetical protein
MDATGNLGCDEMIIPGKEESPHVQLKASWRAAIFSSRFWQQLASFLAGTSCFTSAGFWQQPQLPAPIFSPQQHSDLPAIVRHLPLPELTAGNGRPMLPSVKLASTIAVRQRRALFAGKNRGR